MSDLGPRARPVGCFLAAVVMVVGPVLAWAGETASPAKSERDSSNSGPYCGVYSVYAALQSLGIEVPLEQLLQTKYVGSPLGSSLRELEQAVLDFGGCVGQWKG